MAKKDSQEIFLDIKKSVLIRAVKDPRKKDSYLLTFESKLAKKDSENVLDICSQILGKENIRPTKDCSILFEVKANKVSK